MTFSGVGTDTFGKTALGASSDRFLQDPSSMPITKAADEPYHDLIRLKSQLSSDVIPTAVRVEEVGIHSVRVYQDFLWGNAAFY